MSLFGSTRREDDGGAHYHDDPERSNVHNNTSPTNSDRNSKNQHQGQAVASLLEKYSALHRGIDQARQAQEDQRQAITDTEKAIDVIHVVRREMEEQTIQAVHERCSLLQELEQTMEQLARAQDEHANVVTGRDQARKEMESTIQVARDHQRSFLEVCEEFRKTVRRLSVEAESNGLPHLVAPFVAYSTVHPTRVCEADIALFHSQSTSILPLDTQQARILDESDLSSRLYRNEKGVDKNAVEAREDDEMRQALKRMEEISNSCDVARNNLETIREELSNIQQTKMKEDLQEQNIQSQLQKLETNVQDLRSQLERIEQETEETNQMTLVFQTDVEQRQQRNRDSARKRASARTSCDPSANANQKQSSTSGPSDGVPSAASRTISPNTPGHKNEVPAGDSFRRETEQRRRSQQQRPPVRPPGPSEGSGWTTTTNQQFPHRSGRVRSSRQFGASLRISSTSAAMVHASDRDKPGLNKQLKDGGGNSFRQDDDMLVDSTDKYGDMTASKSVDNGTIMGHIAHPVEMPDDTDGPNKGSSKSKRPRLRDLDDDDDDDDEDPAFSLWPLAFPKGKQLSDS